MAAKTTSAPPLSDPKCLEDSISLNLLNLERGITNSTSSSCSYTSIAHATVARYFAHTRDTGKLGSGPAELGPANLTVFNFIFQSMPWSMLLAQTIWSSVIMLVTWSRGDTNFSTLSISFWSSSFLLPSHILSAVGWALFVLLGFFIREASGRHREALENWHNITSHIRIVIRHIVQMYPQGLWHSGDHDRILAHLIAIPISIKMTLRHEREAQQLAMFLHPSDVDDIIQSDHMHIHCLRVVKSYFTCAEVDATAGFQTAAKTIPAGYGARVHSIAFLDAIEQFTASIIRIGEFRPSAGYVNHLRVFLYIWLSFLPLGLVETSGWFTVLWALLITYGVGMLFVIAMALNNPFGYDIQDIKLNRLASEAAVSILDTYYEERTLPELIKFDHATPKWLGKDWSGNREFGTDAKRRGRPSSFLKRIRFSAQNKQIAVSMSLFLLWMTFVIFLTRGISTKESDDPNESCRWWCIYVPLSARTTSYIGLGVFLLLSFWMNDAYGRYWGGLQLWEANLKPSISRLTFELGFTCRNGTWHGRDRERLFSHIAAIPYAAKQMLRKSRDLSDFEGLLSPEDIAALSESRDLVAQCLRVVYAYVYSVDGQDKDTLLSGKDPVSNVILNVMRSCWNIERCINTCVAMGMIPISPSFTLHIYVFAAIWLILLPLAFVEHNGLLSYLYLSPIAYSILRLIVMGKELADPFGDDPNDIPLEKFCDQLKVMVRDICRETTPGPAAFVHESSWYVERYKSQIGNIERDLPQQPKSFFRETLKRFQQSFPHVSWLAQIPITLWACAAVFISYGLSFTWSEERRNNGCREWCSPADVDKNILLETGFALFLILSFRTADAMQRYQNAATLISRLEKQLRSLLMEMMHAYENGSWHRNDKERIVAHLIQIPMFLCDKLLGTDLSHEKRLLSDEDFQKCIESSDPVRYCIQMVEAYVIAYDVPRTAWDFKTAKTSPKPPSTMMHALFTRFINIGNLVSGVEGIKRFPVVRSYTSYQRLFMAIWLILLPFAMTPLTGFLTILWAPIISYGVLALESLATTLVDPLGDDALDLPVQDMCIGIAENLIEAANSAKWGHTHHVIASPVDSEAYLGFCLDGKQAKERYRLAKLSDSDIGVENFAKEPIESFSSPREAMTKPTLFAHAIRSVPWWVLLAIGIWAIAGVIISYAARTSEEDVRFWNSKVTIDGVIAKYLGFPAFVLLAFFVRQAFGRYLEAGNVWGDDLRATCHTLAMQWLLLSEPGAWHDGDHERVIAHIAAIPIVLKMELRDSRDVRELKGLLSEKDIGRILTAESMSTHCVDVIRAYYWTAVCRPGTLVDRSKIIATCRKSYIKVELRNLEEAIRLCKTLKAFPIAKGFLVLLRTILGIWFLLLPFVLSESNGWFSILWIVIIGYGLVGVYAIAGEIQEPFGRDLNDLDLERMADEIVREVLFVQKNYRGGCKALVLNTVDKSGIAWENVLEENTGIGSMYHSLANCGKKEAKGNFKANIMMIAYIVPAWIMALVAVFSALAILLAWRLHQRWPLNDSCAPSFCVPIAINSVVEEYIGFALFLLLGFRLYDSHRRYVTGITAWKDGILASTGMLASRMFESYPRGSFHAGDIERICAHLAGFCIVTAAKLRREENCSQVLQGLMSTEDITRVERAESKGDHCLNVVRGYLTTGDRMFMGKQRRPSSDIVHWVLYRYINDLKMHAAICERMISLPLPFGYVQHIRILLVIWLGLLPLGLVESTGWWSILWIVIIAYGVIGVERWSEELANPFGTDLSDVPLGKLRLEAVKGLRSNLRCFYNGNTSVVTGDRTALSIITQ